MGLMPGGREKSMGLITVGRLARLLWVLTSLNIMEIMFGMISLTEKILASSLEFGCVCTGLERGWCSTRSCATRQSSTTHSADPAWSDWKKSNAGSYYHPRCYERIGASIAGRF